jgi:hypothetical protein
VRDIVAACSDSLEPDGAPKQAWHERKKRYLESLDDKDGGMLLVALADKIHNARAIAADYRALGEPFWARFAPRTRDDQLWYYRSLGDIFARRLPYHRALPALEDAVRQIEAIAAGEGWIRLTWLERVIADTRHYLGETTDGAFEDRSFAAPGTHEFDRASTELDDVERAAETLQRLEAERDDFRARRGL